MFWGFIYGYGRNTFEEYMFHLTLVLSLTFSLWTYPKSESNLSKIIIVIETIIYFYSLLFLYPEIFSSFMLISLIPCVAIFFFIPNLFYFSIGINIFIMTIFFIYVWVYDKGVYYSYIYTDIFGNYINFLASQAVFYLIFYLTYTRILNQQYYYEQNQLAERVKSSGQIAAAVAHEIRNPITVVKGFIQLYQENQKSTHGTHEHFSLMLEQLQIAETVISDFLEISRPKENIKNQSVNIKEATQSVVDLINSYALLNNITLNLIFEDNYTINCNLIEFKQLLINLIKNAIEASPIGGLITLNVKQNNNYMEIVIIDSGNGMTDEELKSLGTPFYSLKSKGTGLGLTICYNIVHKYNGSIDFKSKKGNGTVATVRFPIKGST
jgi:two-component system sporulation sensor kinase B